MEECWAETQLPLLDVVVTAGNLKDWIFKKKQKKNFDGELTPGFKIFSCFQAQQLGA